MDSRSPASLQGNRRPANVPSQFARNHQNDDFKVDDSQEHCSDSLKQNLTLGDQCDLSVSDSRMSIREPPEQVKFSADNMLSSRPQLSHKMVRIGKGNFS